MCVFRCAATDFQEYEVQRGSLSVTMLSGSPNWHAMFLTNNWPKPSAVRPVVVGMNWACLMSLSATTRTALNPSDIGRPTTKLSDIDSYGLEGIGLEMRRPYLLKLDGLIF